MTEREKRGMVDECLLRAEKYEREGDPVGAGIWLDRAIEALEEADLLRVPELEGDGSGSMRA